VPALRVLAPLAAAAVVAAAVTGCGSGDAGSPINAVAHAADTTASIDGMRIALEQRVDGTKVTGTGFTDESGERGKMLVKAAGRTFIMVNDGMTLYTQPTDPGDEDKVPDGKRWVKIDMQKVGEAQGVDLDAISAVGSSDQRSGLDQLRGATDVRKVGTEDVRGVPTTHYTATLDFTTIAEHAPADRRAAVQRSVDATLQQMKDGATTVPVDVWIDAQDRIRAYAQTMDMKVGTMRIREELYDFGTRETVTIPPKDEVYDATARIVDAVGDDDDPA
jgi:hypothetical protein